MQGFFPEIINSKRTNVYMAIHRFKLSWVFHALPSLGGGIPGAQQGIPADHAFKFSLGIENG